MIDIQLYMIDSPAGGDIIKSCKRHTYVWILHNKEKGAREVAEQVLIQFRVDKDLKQDVADICDALGIEIFLLLFSLQCH